MSDFTGDFFWTEVAGEHDRIQHTASLTHAKVAAAQWWPFLSHAENLEDFENRLSVVSNKIESTVGTSLYDEVCSSLRDDFRAVHEAVAVPGTSGNPEFTGPIASHTADISNAEFYNYGTGQWQAVASQHHGGANNDPRHPLYVDDVGGHRRRNKDLSEGELRGHYDDLSKIEDFEEQAQREEETRLRNQSSKLATNYQPDPNAAWRYYQPYEQLPTPVNNGALQDTDGFPTDLAQGEDRSQPLLQNQITPGTWTAHDAMPERPMPFSQQLFGYQPVASLVDSDGFVVEADEKAPYRLKEEGGKWFVVNKDGDKKEEEGYASKEQARQHQKALYANVPGAAESAKEDEKKKASKTAKGPYHSWWSDSGDRSRIPTLPIKSWEQSQQDHGDMYPNNRAYMQDHDHGPFACGHNTPCPWPVRDEPCQAIEHMEPHKKCEDCQTDDYRANQKKTSSFDKEGYLVEASDVNQAGESWGGRANSPLQDPAPGASLKVNPFYFADGAEMGGNEGFPQDPAIDPQDRVNELYGDVAPVSSGGSEEGTIDGNGYSRSNPGESPNFSSRTAGGMGGKKPTFKPGDRVMDFRGESGTVHTVYPSRDPSKSHKVQVVYDGETEPSHPYYEQVFQHHPDTEDAVARMVDDAVPHEDAVRRAYSSTNGQIVDHCPGCDKPRRVHSTAHGDEIRHLHNDHVRCFGGKNANVSSGNVRTADYLGRPDAWNPTGRGPDDFSAKTWDAYSRQRPLQAPEERGANTPTVAPEPIRTGPNVNTPQPGRKLTDRDENDDDEDED
jgi:TfoX/Sxy family transcriptional regulator of competence genes